MNMKYIYFYALLSSSLLCSNDLSSKSLEELIGLEVEPKVEVGSRSGSRDFLNSMVPIDVITQKQIQKSGLKKLVQVMRYFIPGFNAPTPAIKDGSDHVYAFTLRGLNPDQVLVLINGKRIHSSALIHVNNTVGRGTSSVNLNTIPVISIQRIEVLRDGAAAQYGSDAIAGVINIILKSGGHMNSVSFKTGMNLKGDGATYQADIFSSFALDYDGFVNIAADIQKQDTTDRSGVDTRQQYAGGSVGTSHTTRLGQPKSINYLFSVNSLSVLKNDINVYTHALINYQDSENNAYFRRPLDERNDLSVYPDGFEPSIQTKMLDYSVTAGITQNFKGNSSLDISQTVGGNDMHFYVNNSLNDSIGITSPHSFDNGGIRTFQGVTNLDYKTEIREIKIAVGLEYKYENYVIYAGDKASYSGNTNAGAQGFPGFNPENEVDVSRNNYSVYLDINYAVTPNFLINGAIRLENYSDFSSADNYKLAMSYKVNPKVLLRTSASTGFKAPSLGQSYYTSNSTTLINGNLSSTGTFTPMHELSSALGAKALKPEESKHFTAGFVYKPFSDFSTSFDYFYTQIDDRIMLSTNIAKSSQTIAKQALFTKYNVTQMRYFTNAVDTTTHGIDIRMNYLYVVSNGANLNFSSSFSYAQTKIDSFYETASGLSTSTVERNRIENAQAKDNIKFLFNYDLKPLSVSLNINRYGSYKDVFDDKVHTFSAQWSTDLDIAYAITKKLKLGIGGTNIFDSYPDKWGNTGSKVTGGIVPYSQYAPLGANGAYYYTRLIYEF